MRRALGYVFLLCQLYGTGWAAVQPAGFRIIANVSPSQTHIGRAEMARIFLKEATTWPSGEKAKPVDLPRSSPVRDRFSRAVYGKSAAEMAEYWRASVLAGRDVPPPAKASEAEVVSYVRRVPGAVGYVSLECPLAPGVRELVLVDR